MTKLIELTPLADFFFGGEATFGQGTNRHYFVRSKHWPQQTSLLGMLRYELLKSEPEAFDFAKDEVSNETKAGALIGKQGFDGSHKEPFGIVEGISPVFLLNSDGVPYFLRSRMFLEGAEKTWLEKMPGFLATNLLATSAKTPTAVKKEGYQIMCRKKGELEDKPFDGKTDFADMLIDMNGKPIQLYFDTEVAESDGVFIKVHKTNNRKEYDGSTDESGFFKQDLYRLASGWRFAFLAEFNKDLPTGFGEKRQVQLGAERRLFSLSIGEKTVHFNGVAFEKDHFKNFENLYGPDADTANSELAQVVLLSDARAAPDIHLRADFASSEAVSFRHLNAHLQNPNAVWTPTHEPKSSRHNLLRRGSVFYAKDAQAIQDELSKAAAFRRIGYNYFKTIPFQQI